MRTHSASNGRPDFKRSAVDYFTEFMVAARVINDKLNTVFEV